jgi:glycosyltransferase involved in cell wall biosynthesis/acetyltransferase-like isoleucine patch superfamily enzyme
MDWDRGSRLGSAFDRRRAAGGLVFLSGERVALVCGYLDPKRDGVADYTCRLAGHLRLAGFNPVLVTTHEWARVRGSDAIGVVERWDARGVVAAARALGRLDVDLVHVQFAPSVFGFSRAVGLLPFFLPRGIPLVVTLHEYGVWSGRGRSSRGRSVLWSALERCGYVDRDTLLMVHRAARVLVPAPEHLEVLRVRAPRFAGSALEVPIGLNVEVVPGDHVEARADVRDELGAAPDAPLVVFFGFLHPEKGLDLLIAAMADVRVQRPGAQLLLVGGAESHSVSGAAAKRLRRELEQVAAAYDVQEQVHFTGYLPDTEVSRLLQAADVAAFPFNAGVTRKSGSLLAALAAGVPVVATAAPGEVLAATEADGVLRVPPRDVRALSDALARVLDDGGLVGRLTSAGRALAASQSWEAIAAVHTDVYVQALAARETGSWTKGERSTKVGPRRRKGTRVSLRERVSHGVVGMAAAIRRGASTLGRAPGARRTEDPALFRALVYGDPTRLHVCSTAVVNNALFNLSSGEITVGEHAFFGHNVSVLTGTHDWTKFGAERQVAVPKSGRDVVIEEGVWVSSNAIVVAPCRIGAHAVVGVGALVLRDVDPYTVVAGNPARVLRTIPQPGDPKAENVDPDAGAAGTVTAG